MLMNRGSIFGQMAWVLIALGCGDVDVEVRNANEGGDDEVGDALPPVDAAQVFDGPQPDTQLASCALATSAPIRLTEAGATVENLRIDTAGEPAIVIAAANVTLRNVHVTHRGGPGILIVSAPDVALENVVVEHSAAAPSGPHESDEENNITVFDSPRLRVNGARLSRGSSGIWLLLSPNSDLRQIQGEDFRGPFPRGQLVQWDKSSEGVLDGFSVVNTEVSWPEDNVNVYQSSAMTIRNGFIDGNSSPSGVGVIFDGGETGTGRVEDVDAIHMGNGCFSAFAGGEDVLFLRTRCRDNICEDQGRGAPLSNALMWSGREGVTQLRVEDSTYFASCNGNVIWPDEAFSVIDLVEEEFTPRGPLDLSFCWE